jgi:type IX secretion system PorP/SprF family membrane protein
MDLYKRRQMIYLYRKTCFVKKITLFFLLLATASAFAQQDALFSQYRFNKLVINPAYAGTRDVMAFDLLNRYQWVGIEGAPRTITFSGQTPLRNPHVGLGFYLYSDAYGPTTNQGFMGTYAYRIKLQNGMLAFGLQVGFSYIRIDWDKFIAEDPDIKLQGQERNKIKPDGSFGIFYSTKRFYGGISSTQLMQNEYGMTIRNGMSSYSKLMRHFYAMAGYAFPINEEVVFRPSALIKYVNNAPLQVDIDASFLFNNVFWLGVAYRSKETVIFLTEFNIGNSLRVGYSFDIWLNNFMRYSKGAHEIHIGYDINLVKGRLHSPRYF